MRVVPSDSDKPRPELSNQSRPKRSAVAHRLVDLIPLYDHEQFLFLVERERARADRAAARPPKARRRPIAPAAASPTASPVAPPAAAGNGSVSTFIALPVAPAASSTRRQPKPSTEGVWGATTDNREFSLVIFRPRSRSDRLGLVELLQCCVRTTDAVGVIDTRRLGVLLPDTAAENALLFVKKVLAIAAEQGVDLSHIVHTYPAAWPDEDSPLWNEPRRSHDEIPNAAATTHSFAHAQRQAVDRSIVRGLVNWLQAAAFRRPMRRALRASA